MKGNRALVLILASVLALTVIAKKKAQEVDYDPEQTRFQLDRNVILNLDPSQLEAELSKGDLLNFLYVIDSEQERSHQMTDQIIRPLLNELEGYMRVFVFDCQHPAIKKETQRFQMCQNSDHTPFFQLIKPPEVKINPYTGQPMQMENIPFRDNQVEYKKVYNFVLSNLPDHTEKIDTQKKLESFNSTEDLDVNKVLLFTSKSKAPPILKVLSAKFRDRIRFGFVHQESEDMVNHFEARKFPQIRVYQSYDVEEETQLQEIKIQKYKGDKDYRLQDLEEFLAPFARKAPKERVIKKSSPQSESKIKKPYLDLTSENFEELVLDNEQGALVFFTQGEGDINDEVPYFKKLLADVGGPLNIGIYKMSSDQATLQEERTKFKLGKKLPVLKFFKNSYTGDQKLKSSYQIIDSFYDSLIEELHDAMDHNIKEVNEKILNNMAISGAQEGKFVVIYFYEDTFTSVHFKAISAMPIFRDDFVFLSFSNPTEEILKQFNFQKLPAIMGVLPLENENDENLKQFVYQGDIVFEQMLQNFLQMSNKEQEFYQMKKASKGAKDRKLEEIAGQDDWKKNCLDRNKGCAVALLPAHTIQEYERKNHEEHIQILEALEKEAKTMPIYYMWVNASCHGYMLEYFEVNPMFLPTVVYYYPEKNKYAQLIGKFDFSTIQDHEQRFITGRLSTFEASVRKKDIQFQELDCPSIQLEMDEGYDSDLDDEILREILAEEKAARKEEKGQKGSKKKKSKKKAKKAKDEF